MDLTNTEQSSIYNFATEQARIIGNLNYINLVVCLVIGFLVAGLLTYVAIKFRHKEGDPEPEQSEGNTKLEITWTVIPSLILLVLGVLTATCMFEINPPTPENKQPDVIINARQWWWEYKYPKTGVVTANELVLPEGINSYIEFRSGDVIHDFWVPNFGQKMDCIPGHPNYLYYKPIQKGLFSGACAEYCGSDHSLMGILVKVVSPADFDLWTKSQLQKPEVPGDEVSKHGEELFMNKTCMECHAVAGTKAVALVGPDLSHLSTRSTIGSGLLPNNLENVTNWIMNPQKLKPGCHMPDMRLSKADAHDIAVYLENLK